MAFWPSFQSYSGYLCFLTHHLTFYALASCYQSVLMYWGALVIFLEYPLFDLFYSVECLLDFQFFPGCNQFSSPCWGTMIYLETVSGNMSDMKFDVSQTVKPSSLRFLDSPPFPYWKHHYNGMPNAIPPIRHYWIISSMGSGPTSTVIFYINCCLSQNCRVCIPYLSFRFQVWVIPCPLGHPPIGTVPIYE